MENPTAINKERLLQALSNVPIASTMQLATLLPHYSDPRKKASRLLRELEQDEFIKGNYHGKERIWELTAKGKKNLSPTWRKTKNISHALAVGELYFTLKPKAFLFEPLHKFKYLGEKSVWEPDAIVYGEDDAGKYLACYEIQLTPLSKKRWASKWNQYQLFFDSELRNYEKAKYQEWFKKPVMPSRFIVITNQPEETVRNGYKKINDKDLTIRASL